MIYKLLFINYDKYKYLFSLEGEQWTESHLENSKKDLIAKVMDNGS